MSTGRMTHGRSNQESSKGDDVFDFEWTVTFAVEMWRGVKLG